MKLKTTFTFTVLLLVALTLKSNAQVDNTFSGDGAGENNTGNFNCGFGLNSLSQNTSHSNSAFGIGTLSVATGGFNCAFGNWALANDGSGRLNSAFGTRSLSNNVTGSSNVAIGHRTLEANVNGSNNTAVGYASFLISNGSNNVALGCNTPRNLQTGDNNIFIGTETAVNLLKGNNNVFLGKVILSRNISTQFIAGNDTNNTLIFADGMGNQRLFVDRNGSTGIGLGNNVIPLNGLDIKRGVAIGRNFTPGLNNQGTVAPVGGLIVEGAVGIGTGTPNNKVEITQGTVGRSGLRFTNLTSAFNPPLSQMATKVLSVDASGDVVLQNLPNSIDTNELTSNANVMTSTVNNIAATASIINTVSNTITANNQLVTSVNGVASSPVTLPTHLDIPQVLSQSGNTVTLSNGGGSFTFPPYIDTDAQSLSLIGNTLSISNGNSVTLPVHVDVPQTLTQAGNTVTLSNGGGSFTLPTFTDTDTDAQSLSLSGNTLSISNGNSVVLPVHVDIPQTLTQAGNTVTLSNGGGSFVLPTFTDTDTDAQTLSLNGNTLSISNGNSIVLPTYTDTPQTLSQSESTITLSNGGGSFTLPTTNIVAGNNISVTGVGSSSSPFQIAAVDTSIYGNNGIINQATTINNNRVVDMNNSNIWFNTANSTSNGKIYLGAASVYPNTTGNYKLFVEGGIMTEKVKVALRSTANWADYVFDKNYKLMPLKNVAAYVAANKHLPGIESATDLSKNGLDLAEMQAKHMEKIEELTLYIIEQNKAIEQNKEEIETLKKQVQALIAKTN